MRRLLTRWAMHLTLLCFVVPTFRAHSQGLPAADNFNVAPVDVGWIQYNPPFFLQFLNRASYTIENGAYRIRVPYGTRAPLQTILPPVGGVQPPVPLPETGIGDIDDILLNFFADPRTAGDLGNGLRDVYLARAGSLRPELYADYFQSVDVVKWDHETRGNFFGVASRVGSPVFLHTTGYLAIYLKDHEMMLLTRVMSEIPTILASIQVRLDPNQKYRLVTRGISNSIYFLIYKDGDYVEPLGIARSTDSFGAISAFSLVDALLLYPNLVTLSNTVMAATGASVVPTRLDGEPVKYPGVGLGGLLVFNMDDGPADATFDNYLASGNASTPMLGFPGRPQIATPVPNRNAVFHPAQNGLSFIARTFWTNPIPQSGVTVYLNGTNVSSQLVFAPQAALPDPRPSELAALAYQLLGYPANTAGLGFETLPPPLSALDDGLLVNYPGPLRTNTVYTVQVDLRAEDGATASHKWVFDTFVENQTITVEAEDYNFGGGNFINNPTPSGQGGFSNDYLGNNSPTNAPADGYYGRVGTKAVDYDDVGNTVIGNANHFGVPYDGLFVYYNDYDKFNDQQRSRTFRPLDAVGTTQEAPDAPPRPKTVAAQVSEYAVWLMQNGDWMNYTRQFPAVARPYYNVYLRASAFRGGRVGLERVTSNPRGPNQSTFPLGSFNMQDTESQSRYRFFPLRDSSGSVAAVQLSGEETIRLVGQQVNNSIQLNYLLFVPATNAPSLPTSYKLNEPPSEHFSVQIHKARNNAPGNLFENSPTRAENQLGNAIIDPITEAPFDNEAAGANNGLYSVPVINFEQEGNPSGLITGDTRFPGITTPDPNHIAMSATIYVELAAGLHRWGVNSDDGFRVTTGPLTNLREMLLGAFDGGRGAQSTDFYFVVDSPGVYPFRLLFYEGGGGASVEWYKVHPLTQVAGLINERPASIPPEFSKPSETAEERGFLVRMAKARNNAPAADFPNTALRAERHLSGLIIDPSLFDENQKPLPYENEAGGQEGDGRFFAPGTINYQQSGNPAGFFLFDEPFPGIDPYAYANLNPDYISMEVSAYLDLPAGTHRMGVASDDGFVVTTGPTLLTANQVLGRFDGGRPTAPTEFEFQITQPGVYPFRLLFYEGQGGADVEWYMVDLTNKKRVLINDSNDGIPAFAFRQGDAVIPEIEIINLRRIGNDIEFQFSTVAGTTYLVESKGNLTDSAWNLVETVTGTGQDYSTLYPMSGDKTFYRVRTAD